MKKNPTKTWRWTRRKTTRVTSADGSIETIETEEEGEIYPGELTIYINFLKPKYSKDLYKFDEIKVGKLGFRKKKRGEL